jgi:hypothetical protein
MSKELIKLENFTYELTITDLNNLIKLAEPIKKLKNDDLLLLYEYITDQRTKTWAFRCLVSFEAHRRGISYEELGKVFGRRRETLWADADIWKYIISKDPSLLLEKRKWFKKTFYHNVAKLKRAGIIDDPVKEMWWILDYNDKCLEENEKRKEKGMPLLKLLTPSSYFNKKAKHYHYCDKCGRQVYPYHIVKLCDICKEKLDAM